jgi:nicotinamidase-related amidase
MGRAGAKLSMHELGLAIGSPLRVGLRWAQRGFLGVLFREGMMKRTNYGLLAGVFLLIVSACTFDSQGPAIANYSDPTSVLMILDVQKDFTSGSARMPVGEGMAPSMISNINRLEHGFAGRGRLIIYVRNIFSRADIIGNIFRHGAAVEGSGGVAYDERLEILDGAHFAKSVPDMFSNPGLESYLVNHRVSQLYMTGVFADQCVYWSSKSALNRKYSVILVADAVASGEGKTADLALARLRSLGARTQTTEEVLRH